MDIQRIIKGIRRKLNCYPLFYPKKKDDAVRWAIIGLGNMAEVFASALDADADSKIVAVASRSIGKAQAFATRHGQGRSYGSYEEMLSDESLQFDVVYIATPAKYHAEHIKLCLDAGKNVLCEKPIAMFADELQPLMAIAKEKNIFLMEGMWMKCLPTFRKAIEWSKEGLIGEIELIKVDFYKREIINPNLSIFNENEGGGVMHDYGVYAIAFATTFLGGEPEELTCNMRKSELGIDTDWQIFASRKGIKAYIGLSSDFKGLSKAALIGSNGVIEWDSQFNRTNRLVRYDKYGKIIERFKVHYKSEGFEYEIEEVNSLIRQGITQSDTVGLQASLDTIKLIDKLVKS